MEEAGGHVNLLTAGVIVSLNKTIILESGGLKSRAGLVQNVNSFQYLVEFALDIANKKVGFNEISHWFKERFIITK